MSFTSSTLRSALSINNSGVGLLEHGHFREAQRTFREALLLMKQVIKKQQQQQPSHHQGEEEYFEETALLLQSVSNRLVRAQANPILTVFDIRAIEDSDDDVEDCLTSTIKSSLRYGPSSSLVFPIRIRRSSQQQDDTINNNNNITMQSRPLAIILYNQALSHSLWAQSPENVILLRKNQQEQQQSSSSLHFHAALSSLKVAHSVLSRHLARIKNNSSDTTVFQTRQGGSNILLQALVVNNLIQVLQAAAKTTTMTTAPYRLDHAQKEQQEQQQQRRSLQDWIQLRDHLLLEYSELMDNDEDNPAVAAVMARQRGQSVQCSAAA